MGKALIIGCGGVAGVTIHKCCQNPEVFEEIMIASRTKAKCDALKQKLQGGKTKIRTAQVDADNVDELVKLIEGFGPDIVINLALPYQDLHIMGACLKTKVDYVDTANYEPTDTAKFEYSWQWAYRERYKAAGITALLGSGFDPGVTSVFCAYAQKHYFDTIEEDRHPRLQRRRPRLPVRDQLQSGDQHPRGKRQGQLLGERPLGGDRADGN